MTGDDAELIRRHAGRCPDRKARESWRVARWNLPGKWMLLATNPAGKEWVVKVSIDHGNRAPETCKREHLISLLGQAVGVPAVDAWTIPTDGLLHLVEPLHEEAIRDHAVLMPRLAGEVVERVRDAAKAAVTESPADAADIFAFMHWIGDEDRSLADVMLVDGRLVLIDNGLCGPGRDSRIRSYHPMPDPDPTRLVLKCYGGGKPALVEFVLRDAAVSSNLLADPPVISRIEALGDAAVENFVGASSVEGWVADVLNARKSTLRSEYTGWLSRAVEVCRR